METNGQNEGHGFRNPSSENGKTSSKYSMESEATCEIPPFSQESRREMVRIVQFVRNGKDIVIVLIEIFRRMLTDPFGSFRMDRHRFRDGGSTHQIRHACVLTKSDNFVLMAHDE